MIKITAADEAFSDYIRARDGWECRRCLSFGKRSIFRPPEKIVELFPQFSDRAKSAMGLHNMHCFGRRGKSTRFDEDNCIAGCYGCHSYLDEHPFEKWAFFRDQLGVEKFNELRIRAKKIVKGVNLDDIKSLYREKLRKLCSVS